MATNLAPVTLMSVAHSFHRGAFNELRGVLHQLRSDANTGRLSRQEQAILLELAEYGLFYTSFYDRILNQMNSSREVLH